jgi:hypothetical protein
MVDPTGLELKNVNAKPFQQASTMQLGEGKTTIAKEGCVLDAALRIANAISGKNISLEDANTRAVKEKLFSGKDKDELSTSSMAKLISELSGVKVKGEEFIADNSELTGRLASLDYSRQETYATGRIKVTPSDGKKPYEHEVNIDRSIPRSSTTGAQPVLDTSNVKRTETKELTKIRVFQVEKK